MNSVVLRLYDTRRRKKENFVPLTPPKVSMYVCGITPYGPSHLGHARCYVVFDVLFRWLKARGWDVTYVRNYTDIDDKIINTANEEGIKAAEVAERCIASYIEDMDALNVLRPDHEPRVTETIPEIIDMIDTLVEKKHAYTAEDGVWFDVSSAPEKFGLLTGQSLDQVRAGASGRISGSSKRSHHDFALWKAAKPDEPSWPSPFGEGRPGWHIECSAMSLKHFGETFDIHGGGHDLRFPHHECEIMQSECSTGQEPVVTHWMHNGFVNMDGEKMSKSLGNVWTISEAIEQIPPLALRFALLNAHYRTPIDMSEALLEESRLNHQRLVTTYRKCIERAGQIEEADRARLPRPDKDSGVHIARALAELEGISERISLALDDDVNTREAIQELLQARRAIEEVFASESNSTNMCDFARWSLEWLEECASTWLGLLPTRSEVTKLIKEHNDLVKSIADDVELLLSERAEVREEKNWNRADAIRDQLNEMGVIVEDGPDGPSWRLRSND